MDFFRIQYECQCKSWSSLSYMFYCPDCKNMRCDCCVREEVDSIYCPNCLDSTSITDAKTGYCSECYECPICGQNLIKRAQAEGHYLHCPTCMWNTNEVGLHPRDNKCDWSPPANPMAEKLTGIIAHYKNLALPMNLRGEGIEMHQRSESTLGIVKHNKWGLAKSLELRRPHLGLPTTTRKFEFDESTDQIPELDPSIFTEPVDQGKIQKLSQVIRLPQCDPTQVFPIRKRMSCRLLVRCPEHELLIYRGEYDISNVNARHYFPCNHFCPEIRLSRELQFSNDDDGFYMPITITNSSTSNMKIIVAPLEADDPDCLIVTNHTPLEFELPKRDGTITDLQLNERTPTKLYASDDAEEIGTIVFKSNHRIGLNYNCRIRTEGTSQSSYLLLLLYYKRDEYTFKQRVKIFAHKLDNVDLH
ncbi:hypothetical protein M3Y96_00475200 [Aphelenchoides besseyi]|nr:hypothetical protein M3Y96_00475200 [Aphelenchoides besseyi]